MLTLLWKKWLNRMAGHADQLRRSSGGRTYRTNRHRPLQVEPLEDRLLLDAYIGNAVNTRYDTIQAAIDASHSGDSIYVTAGTYSENLTIDHNITLLSTDGRANTTIQGNQNGNDLGTVVVTNDTTGVQIGDIGHGFTIEGIDGPSPAIESAAIYFQGNNSGAKVIGNNIVANGDEGLLTEWSAVIRDFQIDSNIFSGKTFTGDNPGGDGFSTQFDTPNVPRQLVVMGGGTSTNSSNITFTNNEINGTAGGWNTDGKEQGNYLVTIDATNAVIEGNLFDGTTTRYGASFRGRGAGTTITGNSFISDGLTPTANQVEIVNTGQTLADVAANNTFDKGVYIDGATGTIGHSIQVSVNAAQAGDTVHVLNGTYNEYVIIPKDLTLAGSGVTVIQAPSEGTEETAISIGESARNVTVQDLALQGWATGLAATGLTSLTLNNVKLTGNTDGGSLSNIDTVNYTPTAATVAANATIMGDSIRNSTGDTISYSQVAALNVQGSDKADVFTITPPRAGGTLITVDGGKPTPSTAAGDTLVLDLTDVMKPVLTANPRTDGTGYEGQLTSLNRQQVSFTHIETLTPSPDLQGSGKAVSGTSGVPLSNVVVGNFTFLNNSYPASDFQATINWGDESSSTGTVVPSDDGYVVKGSHTYTSGGSFTIDVTITKGDLTTTLSTTANIDKATLSITFAGNGYVQGSNSYAFTYNGSAHSASASVTGGGTVTLTYYQGSYGSSEELQQAIDANTAVALDGAPTDASDYTVLATYGGNNNYAPTAAVAALHIAKANATIAVQDYNGTYDGEAHGLSGSAIGVQGEDLHSLLDLGASQSNTGIYTIDWSFAGNSNYNAASGSATIRIANPTPVIADLSQTSVVAGSGTLTLTVNGSGFVPGSVVQWNGTPLATTYVSGNQLTAVVPAEALAQQGTANVSVVNVAPGGGTSNVQPFTITAAPPSDAPATPASVLPAADQGWSSVMGYYHLLSFLQLSKMGLDPLSSLSWGAVFARFHVALGILKGSDPLMSLLHFNNFLAQTGDLFVSSIVSASLTGKGSTFAPASGSPSDRVQSYYQSLGLSADAWMGADTQLLASGVPEDVVMALIVAQHGTQMF